MVDVETARSFASACIVITARVEGEVTCPHCGGQIVLKGAGAQEKHLSVVCPHCEDESLLVRAVSVLHRAVRLPGEVMAQLRRDVEENVVEAPALRTPMELFSLTASRGALVLLAMMWQQAERTGSIRVQSTVTLLSQRLLTSRGMVRRWLSELVEAGVVRELSTPEQRPRVWELLPIPPQGKEVGRG